jgi:hypothetical protein
MPSVKTCFKDGYVEKVSACQILNRCGLVLNHLFLVYERTMASSDSTAISKMYLHNLDGNIKLVRRVIKGKDGKPGETQVYISNALHNPGSNLIFMLGDADAGRLATVIRKPGTFENKGEGSITMMVKTTGEDADGLRMLQRSVFDGMKELGLISAAISPDPSIIKLIMSPMIYEREDGTVGMTMNITDDTEFNLKITKGKHAGKFMRISKDQVRDGDGVVVIIRCDRHREKPKHRFTRYTQRVFIIERAAEQKSMNVIGSGGSAVDVIDYDPEMEDELEGTGSSGAGAGVGGGSSADAAAAAAAGGASSSHAKEDDGDDDEFSQALKRARGAGAV